jgi:hypothetical protein
MHCRFLISSSQRRVQQSSGSSASCKGESGVGTGYVQDKEQVGKQRRKRAIYGRLLKCLRRPTESRSFRGLRRRCRNRVLIRSHQEILGRGRRGRGDGASSVISARSADQPGSDASNEGSKVRGNVALITRGLSLLLTREYHY